MVCYWTSLQKHSGQGRGIVRAWLTRTTFCSSLVWSEQPAVTRTALPSPLLPSQSFCSPIPPPLGVGREHKAGGSEGAHWMKGTCPAERRPAQRKGAGAGLTLSAALGWHHYMPISLSPLLKLFNYEI